MARSDRRWPAPRLTAFAWWWLTTRFALPLVAAAAVAECCLN